MKGMIATQNLKKRLWSIFRVSLLLPLLFVFGCKDFSFFTELGGKGGLKINPSEVTILVSSTLTFQASGGNEPYTFEVISGSGCIDAETGYYTTPACDDTDVVMVIDSTDQSATATVTAVSSFDVLEINPKSASLAAGGSITFVGTGGVEPYEFDFQSNNSGGSITSGGVYTAGSTTGVSDTIIVRDSDIPQKTCSVAAVVSVTAAVTNVDYEISGENFPATVLAGDPIAGVPISERFQIYNSGSATGTNTVAWWLFVSEDGSLGGDGEQLVDNGSVTADIPSLGSHPVTPGGSWPTDLPAGGYHLFVMIASPDDMNHGNNVCPPIPVTIEVPDVDYRVDSVTCLDSTPRYGQPFSGEFDLDNSGLDDSSELADWEVWISEDTAIGSGDIRIDSGIETSPAMTAAQSLKTEAFSGVWPHGSGNSTDYYLIVRVSSTQDSAAGNDTNNTAYSGPITVSKPDVNYDVLSVTHGAGEVAARQVDGSFSLENIGTDNGAVDVSWTVYASSNDNTVDIADTVVDFGTALAMNHDDTPQDVFFSGIWPETPDNYYLVVEILASDDMDDSNDEEPTATFVPVRSLNVDYKASNVNNLGGVTAGGVLDGEFMLENAGLDDSLLGIQWSVYVSDDTSLDGSDTLVQSDSGTDGWLTTAETPTIGFSGTWPETPGEKYYLLVKIESAEDVISATTGNNLADSGPTPITTTAPNVDYRVTEVNYTSGTPPVPPGTALEGDFRYANDIAAENGAQALSWEAYASLDANLSAGDVRVASGGPLPALDANQTSSSIDISGTWPLDYGDYYLIVKVTSPDNELNTDDDKKASGLAESIGIYSEAEPNDNWTDLPGPSPGTDYQILSGSAPLTPIAFEPGMSIRIDGVGVSNSDRDDVFMLNTGTASSITCTVIWNTGESDIDVYVFRAPGDFGADLIGMGGPDDELSVTIVEGGAGDQFVPYEDLWLDVYCNLPGGSVSPYTVIITAN